MFLMMGIFFDRLNYVSIKSSNKNLQKNATWFKKLESIKKKWNKTCINFIL